MKGKPGIPDAGTTRALMTGCGQQIDYIVRSGMARSAKVRAVIEPQQLRVAAPPYNERPQDEALWMPGRDSLTFGRNSTARSRSKKPY
ncbi:MAG: hypothetical protein NZ553_17100 [Caldilinea sp.]|nr:hypothetical protein [Caldilinea sp.]MDW8442199.1 hypothetical protein [Caldilineaceae bacterium]